jgi:hypothetical protein
MSNFQISALAPIEAKRSDKYVVIDTSKVVENLLTMGFEVREILRSKNGKGVHRVRLRTNTPFVNSRGEILFFEITLLNSYDKSCFFRVKVGIFRQICTNGLCIQVDGMGDEYVVRHMGTEAEIAEGIAIRAAEIAPKVFEVQETLATTVLTDRQIIDLAVRTAEIRFQKKFTRNQVRQLLDVARPEDDGRDAWAIFNVLEEKIIKGGIKLEGQKRTSRPITRGKVAQVVGEKLFESVLEMATVGKLSPMKLPTELAN